MHPLRFEATPGAIRNTVVWPAQAYAGNNSGANLPPFGQRFRLKASVDISRYSPNAQTILRALKSYGMMLTDFGNRWAVTLAPGPWPKAVTLTV